MGTPSNKVLTNVDQTGIFSESEKAQGRANINAAKNAVATQSSNGLMSASDKTKLDGIQAGAEANVQADWTQTDSSADDYIKNKPALASIATTGSWNDLLGVPSGLVIDALYVHTDENFTAILKAKLEGIEAGAQVNVQSDWDQSDNTQDDYIKNKPDINYYNWNEDESLEFDQSNRKIRVNPNLTVVTSPYYGDYSGRWAKVATLPSVTQSSINHKMTHLEIEVTDYIGTYSGLFVVDIMFDRISTPLADGYWVYAAGNTSGSGGRIKQMHLYSKDNEFQLWVELRDFIPYYKFISFKATKNVLCSNHRTSSNGHVFHPDVWNFNGFTHTVGNGPDTSEWTEVTLSHSTPEDNGVANQMVSSQVNSDWTASSGKAKILNKPNLQRVVYGGTSSELTGLKFDADDPEGYVGVTLDSDQRYSGLLVAGPYKDLLDSGVNGLGDSSEGVYIDSNGQFQRCTKNVVYVGLNTSYADVLAHVNANREVILRVWPTVDNPLFQDFRLMQFNPDGSMEFTCVTSGYDSINAYKYMLYSNGMWQRTNTPGVKSYTGIQIDGVGRNLHRNQNNYLQTNLPGGVFDAPVSAGNNFERISGANFAGAYMLACRHNASGTYEIGIAYTASGTSGTYWFLGTETVIGTDNSVTTNQAVYNATAYYTPSNKFGGTQATAFDPSIHKAIIYNGIGLIGPCSDCKIVIYNENGTVKLAFTAIEVGKVGATN